MLLFSLPFVYCILLMLILMPVLLKRKDRICNVDKKKVAVLVPTYNDENTISEVLCSIMEQDGEHEITVFVINDGSSDNTLTKTTEFCDNYSDFHVISIDANTGRKGYALDFAKMHINEHFDVVACIDADTILHPAALTNCIRKLYSKRSIAAVTGCIIPWEKSRKSPISYIQKLELGGAFHAFKFVQSSLGCINTLAGALSVYKREALEEVGWFSGWLVEDICWTWKANTQGYQVKYVEDAIGWTLCPINYCQYFKQRRRLARGRIEAIKSASNIFRILNVLPWFIFSLMQLLLTPFSFVLFIFEPYFFFAMMFILVTCHCIYAWHSVVILNKLIGYTVPLVLSGIVTSFIGEVLMFIPNILGVCDEIFQKEKNG